MRQQPVHLRNIPGDTKYQKVGMAFPFLLSNMQTIGFAKRGRTDQNEPVDLCSYLPLFALLDFWCAAEYARTLVLHCWPLLTDLFTKR